MQKRFTIQDVANLAGVGKVTVSYVLNGRASEARITKETCDRVMAAARELDYRPSAVAKSLVSKRANAISVVFQYANYFSAGSSFINEVMRGVCEICVEADVNLILHTRSFTNTESEVAALMDGRSDGVLLLRDYRDPLAEQLVARGFPCVLFFTRSSSNSLFVDADNFSGGRVATEHLISLGHKRIAFIRGSVGSVASNDRLLGCRSALENHGLTLAENMICQMEDPTAANLSMVDWVRNVEPTAILCWSDDVAVKCMQILQQSGFSIPNDISVVGFDSSEACERVTPTLTSMRQPLFEMGKLAAENLIKIIDGKSSEVDCALFPLTLDVRGSTAPTSSHSSTKRIL
jgi:DNA-binding LacI/PurR family transcriptional regulator